MPTYKIDVLNAWDFEGEPVEVGEIEVEGLIVASIDGLEYTIPVRRSRGTIKHVAEKALRQVKLDLASGARSNGITDATLEFGEEVSDEQAEEAKRRRLERAQAYGIDFFNPSTNSPQAEHRARLVAILRHRESFPDEFVRLAEEQLAELDAIEQAPQLEEEEAEPKPDTKQVKKGKGKDSAK